MPSLCTLSTLLQELCDEIQGKKASGFEKNSSRSDGFKHPKREDQSRVGKANTKGQKIGQTPRMAA